MIEITQIEQPCIVGQVNRVHIPGDLLAVGHPMEVAHAGILSAEAAAGTNIARIRGTKFLWEYCLPLWRLYVDLERESERVISSEDKGKSRLAEASKAQLIAVYARFERVNSAINTFKSWQRSLRALRQLSFPLCSPVCCCCCNCYCYDRCCSQLKTRPRHEPRAQKMQSFQQMPDTMSSWRWVKWRFAYKCRQHNLQQQPQQQQWFI